MIAGIGIDIVEIGRLAHLIEKYGDRFRSKVFTVNEQRYCDAMAVPAIHYAGRWAAKEAFYKALPIACQPLAHWKSVEIIPAADGRAPRVHILDERLERAMRESGVRQSIVSISHEKTTCVAIVCLE